MTRQIASAAAGIQDIKPGNLAEKPPKDGITVVAAVGVALVADLDVPVFRLLIPKFAVAERAASPVAPGSERSLVKQPETVFAILARQFKCNMLRPARRGREEAEPVNETPQVTAYREQVKADLELAAETTVEAFSFGDSPDLANELATLVVSGPKRATVGWIAEAEKLGETLPKVGDYSIVLDGAGRPRCAIRTTETRRGPLLSVDAAFAWDEGEGDRTLDWWLGAHRTYFARRSVELGLPFDEKYSELLFERFEVVHRAA